MNLQNIHLIRIHCSQVSVLNIAHADIDNIAFVMYCAAQVGTEN